ncbi:MAG TPA: homogentisate 1,2-dioxygenase, partial [Candidatus Berkiella sp.]|nr:homogentisate 1,2-dioxygenase [Candidatus Berkiella sp.]
MTKEYTYQKGFGSYWQSEALPGALPQGQNSPQKPPFGLYAEQLSGSAFTRTRHLNYRSWLYRILPSVVHSPFQAIPHEGITLATQNTPQPTQMRWHAISSPHTPTDFIASLKTLLFNGAPSQHQGAAIHLYAANTNMGNRYFYSADG